MKKITYFFLLLNILSLSEILAQQDAHYTHYAHNMNVINPAYAGSRETLSIGLLGRTQWVGFEGHPKTMTAAIHAPVGKRLNLGFSVISDVLGPVAENNIYADIAYAIKTSETTKLAFGIKGGVSLLNLDIAGIVLPESITSIDPAFQGDVNNFYPNFGAGLFFYSNKFYLGASVPNFLESLYIGNTNDNLTGASEIRHGFLTAGYVFDLNDKLKLKPATMIKAAVGAPLSFDGSLSFLYNNKIEIGANYRLNDSVSGTLLVTAFDNFRIGYAYDYTLSDLGLYNSGSHEVILLWDIFTNNVVRSPRFF